MVCEHVILIWCEASMRCNQSLYVSWHGIKEALDIFLRNVPPRNLYASSQSVKSRCWRTLTNKSPTNHIPDMFDERHVWRTCRPGKQWYPRVWKKACTILATCGRALYCWNMVCGFAWRRGSTSGCNTSLMLRLPSIRRKRGRLLYPMAPQTITLGVGPLCRWKIQALRLRSPRTVEHVCDHHCRTCWSWARPKTLHFVTKLASDGVHVLIAVWGVGGLWTMEADTMAMRATSPALKRRRRTIEA